MCQSSHQSRRFLRFLNAIMNCQIILVHMPFFCVTCNTNDSCQNNGEHKSHISKRRLLCLEENFSAVGYQIMTRLRAYTLMYIYVGL